MRARLPRRPARVFLGARVRSPERNAPPAEALTVADGRFVVVGDAATARAAAGPDREEIDLGGGWVLPGFHDAHLHLATGALTKDWVDLRTCRSAEEAVRMVAAAARSLPEGAWIRGWGWDQTRWPGGAWPTRADLDRAAPAHAVVLSRVCTHAVWANTPALAALGITTRDGAAASDEVPRDAASGEATGILLERAAERAAAAVAPPDGARRKEAVEGMLREAAAVGVTSVEDVTEPWALPLYAELRREGKLTARVSAWLPADVDRSLAEDVRREHPADDPWLSAATLKLFLDGTLGSRSAALREPYSDDPSTSGVLRIPYEELRERVRDADGRGWCVALHAIGDLALRVALDALGTLPRRPRGRPHRIEHVQVATAGDLARLARLGALASIQPVHLVDDRAWISQRLGDSRDVVAYPWRSLLRAGAAVAMGTDWPIAPLDPLRGIAAAATRAGMAGPLAGETLSVEEAVAAYTSGSARGRGAGAGVGALRAGFHADFVVLSADPRDVRPENLPADVRVLATFCGGRQVHPVPRV